MFPLGSVLLPGERLPLQVFEPRYLALVDECLNRRPQPEFAVVLISRGHEVGGGDHRTDVGVLARIVSAFRLPGDRLALDCRGGERIRVDEWLPDDPYPRARVRPWPDTDTASDSSVESAVAERVAELRSLAAELADRTGGPPPGDPLDDLPRDPVVRSYALAARLPLAQSDRYAILAAPNVAQRTVRLADALDDLIAAVQFELME